VPGPQPDVAYFDVMAQQARSHWWYEGRRRLVTQILTDRLPVESRVLDVGCGTGDNLDTLEEASGGPAVGAEFSVYAVAHARLDSPRRVLVARAEALPVRSMSVDLVASMDVIEHLDDDIVALREFRRALSPGGLLLLTVPAYQWLWSDHDDWAAHRRRYTSPRLVQTVESAGFVVLQTSYFNSFLLPPAVLLRRTPLRRLVRSSDDEVGTTNAAIARVMGSLSRSERWVLRRRRVPFGLSIVMLARRPS
jgi:SAM-dependent methyltransferase